VTRGGLLSDGQVERGCDDEGFPLVGGEGGHLTVDAVSHSTKPENHDPFPRAFESRPVGLMQLDR